MDLAIEILEFANSFARGIGLLVASAVRLLVPGAAHAAEDLAAPIGWLALLTAGLTVAEVVKRLTWVVVGVGWLLITIRIVIGGVGR